MAGGLSRMVSRQVSRFRNAAGFGLLFLRNRWFTMPAKLRVGGVAVNLEHPQEDAGVKTDLVGCLIRDDYGIANVDGEVKTILDIGANLGFFCMAARQRHPDAIINAYEPNPRAWSYLTANIARLKVAVFAEAVGSRPGRVRVLEHGPINLATTHLASDGEALQVSFDQAIERLNGRVDFLKLDCEGCEWGLFECTEGWSKVQNLRMEYHLGNDHTVESLEATLQGLGFRITKRFPSQGFGIVWAHRV
jgi:FkbM family methyltransferase